MPQTNPAPVGHVNFDEKEYRLARVHRALRAVSALAFSEHSEEEAVMVRRRDFSDLIEVIREEMEYALTGTRPLI